MSFYDDASWLLIPSGIKEDVVYAQKPTSGLGDLTFTRASDATYTDSTGVVRRSPYNLLTFSEMFSDVAWTKFNSLITANVTAAPNGTLTADKLALAVGIDPLSANSTGLFQTQTITSGVYNYSIYLKASERNIARWRDGGFSGNYLVVNLTNGTFTNGEPSRFVNPQVVSVGNGWWRVSFTTGTITNSNAYPLRFGDTGQTGDGVSGGFVWGAQLVEGTSALDYFPTTNRQDVPRIDFRNADGTLSSCGRLLLEPQRTNFVLRSEEFDSATWTKSLTTVVANAEISPDGTQDAETMTVSTSASFVEQTVALTAGTYTFSVYVKVISQTTAGQMRLQAVVDGVGLSVNFTPTTQWQRFTSTYTPTATLTNVRVRGQTFVGTVAVWGGQLETGAYPTTYIPTTTAAVTRIKDDAQKTGVSSIIGQSAGTIFWDVNDVTGTTTGTGNPDFGIRNTAFTNWIGITTDTFATPFRIVVRATSGLLISYIANITRAKAAVAWSSAGAVLYVNGVQVGTSAVNPNFSFDRIDMLGGIISYKTNQAALFPTRLTNAQLAELTTL
jgi:hypothetical protein